MNVKRAASAKQQCQNQKIQKSYCPLLHLVTLITTCEAKKIPSLQDKIDQCIKQLEGINIQEIIGSSFMVLIESYYSHLEGSQNMKRLVQVLCSKINKNTQTQFLVDLLEILAKQYHLRGQKDRETRVLFEAFSMGLGMKRKVFKTFSFGVHACQLMSMKDFQKNINNVITAIKGEIQSNTNTLTKNISLASQVYGCKLMTKQDKKDPFKENKHSYMRKIMQKSSSQHRIQSQYRPGSPELRVARQDELNVEMNKIRGMSNTSQCGFIQKPQRTGSQKNYNTLKIMHSKTVHKASQNNNEITLKIKTKVKSKTQLLPFYILLYEAYTICLLKINSQLKKKFYRQGRTELKDKIVREYPGRNIQQVLYQIELDKLKAYESKQEPRKQLIKISSPSSSTLLKKGKIFSSSSISGKLSLNSIAYKENKSAISYEPNQFQTESATSSNQFFERNGNMLGVKMRSRVSKFSNQKQRDVMINSNGQDKIVQQKQQFKRHPSKKGSVLSSFGLNNNVNSQMKDSVVNQRKSSFHFRTRIISSKSEHKGSLKQEVSDRPPESIYSNFQSEKKQSIHNISKVKTEEKKSSIFERLKHNENKEKLVLKKKAKQLIQQKNFLKLNDFTKTYQESQMGQDVDIDNKNENILDQKEKKVSSEVEQKISNVQTKQNNQKIIQNQQKSTQKKENNQQISQESPVQEVLIQVEQKQEETVKQLETYAETKIDEPNQQQKASQQVAELVHTQQNYQQSQVGIFLESKEEQKQDLVQQVQQNNQHIPLQTDSKQIKQDAIPFRQNPSQSLEQQQLDLKQIVNQFLQTQIAEKLVDQILQQPVTQHQHQPTQIVQNIPQLSLNFQNKPQPSIVSLSKPQHLNVLQNKPQKQIIELPKSQPSSRSTFYYPSLNPSNEQVPPITKGQSPIISNRRIAFCDIESQESHNNNSQKKLEQSVYEIMIMDTPMNGHALYSSTNRSGGNKQQQGKMVKNDLQQQKFVQIISTQQKNFLQVPSQYSSDGCQDEMIQQKRMDSLFNGDDIGFEQIKELQVQVRNNDDAKQQGDDEIQEYFSKLYGDVTGEVIATEEKQNKNQCSVKSNTNNDQKVLFLLRQENNVDKTNVGLISTEKNYHQNKNMSSLPLTQQLITPSSKDTCKQQLSLPPKLIEKFTLDKEEEAQQQQQQQTPEYMDTYSSSQQFSQQQCISNTSIRQTKEPTAPPIRQQNSQQPQTRPYRNNVSFAQTTQILNHNDDDLITNHRQNDQVTPENNTNKTEEILTVQNNICSLLNATNIQYSQTSRLNITEFSPVVPTKKFPPQSDTTKQQKQLDSSILAHESEDILDLKSNREPKSVHQDLADMAELVKNRFISPNHHLKSNISIETKKSIATGPKRSRNSLSQYGSQQKQKLNTSKESSKKKNIQVPLPRQQTIESNKSSNQQSHTIIISHHVLKPQIFVSDTLVRLTVYHPEEKKTCQVEKEFIQPINVKDYMKGLQARITKFLDNLINEGKEQKEHEHDRMSIKSTNVNSKGLKRSISINSQSLKRSKKQQLQRSIIINDLINHGHPPQFNWQHILQNISHINLDQQLWNLKSFLVPYNKNQHITLNLMHYVDYNRVIIEYKKNPLELRSVEISIDLNESINEIVSLFNEDNVKIELTEVNNEIKPILQVYNLWCQLQTLAISLKNSSSRLKSLFKLNQFTFKSSENATKYNMLIQMIHSDNEKENLVISDLNLIDRNKLANNFSVVVGYAVKIQKGRAKFIVGGRQVKTFLNML